jgi:serine protease Do
VTNYHVVCETDKVEVKLNDGRTFDGQVIGTDDFSDLAVIKIEAADLPLRRTRRSRPAPGGLGW